MSDSLRERKGQCQRCYKWREGVDQATEWTCGECRLRERCAELERENAALQEQLTEAQRASDSASATYAELHAIALQLLEHRNSAARCYLAAYRRCEDLRAQVAGLERRQAPRGILD